VALLGELADARLEMERDLFVDVAPRVVTEVEYSFELHGSGLPRP
jgi:hypothetical protein